jgi:hypothetical protein
MEMETGQEEDRQAVSERHRVLIAAATAALAGSGFRILEIKPAEEPSGKGWERRGPVTNAAERAVPHRCIRVHVKAARKRKEEQRETAHHA